MIPPIMAGVMYRGLLCSRLQLFLQISRFREFLFCQGSLEKATEGFFFVAVLDIIFRKVHRIRDPSRRTLRNRMGIRICRVSSFTFYLFAEGGGITGKILKMCAIGFGDSSS